MEDIVTKASLAAELGCSRSRLSQLKGMPIRPDGKLNRPEVLAWIIKFKSGHRGGWHEGIRGKDLHTRAKALLATSENQKSKTERRPATDRLPVNLPEAVKSVPFNREVTVDVLRQVSSPVEALAFAVYSMEFGCTPEQAYALGTLHAVMPLLCFEEIEYEDIRHLPDPTKKEWRSVLGDVDFGAAGRIYKRFHAFVAEVRADE